MSVNIHIGQGSANIYEIKKESAGSDRPEHVRDEAARPNQQFFYLQL